MLTKESVYETSYETWPDKSRAGTDAGWILCRASRYGGDAAWVASGTTAEFEGTIPWLYREGGNATINSDDADHIKVTSDGKGTRPSGSETDKRLYSGDTITLGWDIGDTEGDIDDGPDGIDAKTTATIKWYSYSDNAGGGKTELTAAAGKTSYKLTNDERGRYIGVEIQPITQTGNPFQGTSLTLLDISTASGAAAIRIMSILVQL